MRAIILVGGKGMRLRPLTLNTPKPVVPVLNQPLLLYQIKLLKNFGITDISLSSFYLPKKLHATLKDGGDWGVKLSYVLEDVPLGTAGAANNAYLRGAKETTVVFNGDILTCLDLEKVLTFHRQKKSQATLVLTPVEDPSAYGLVETNRQARITSFLEKPSEEEITTFNISAGAYILEPEVFELIPPRENVSFERGTFPAMLRKGFSFYGYTSDSYWLDIGTPEKYLQANLDMIDQAASWEWALGQGNRPGTTNLLVSGSASEIGSKAVYRSVVGAGVRISAGASVRDSVLWDDVIIGKNCLVKHSIIGKGCVVEEKCRLRNVVLADGSHIKKGSLLS